MDKYLLKLVALFRKIFISQGVDYERMITIVQTKLMMDKRRVYMNWKQRQQKKENANHLNGVLLFYAIFGVFVSILLFAIPSLVLGMIIIHSYILFMMAMTLITDFSTVLLDTTDNQVILPKPVSSKTLFMARLIHILIYLLQFTIAIAALPIVIAFFKYNIIAGLVFICTTLLTVLFAVFITYLLYLLIIKFSSESKVKDIITYFQIFMTVVFTVGFQILPRMIHLTQLTAFFQLHWYSYLLPPVWMALTIEAFSTFNFDTIHLVMIAAALILPLFTFWFMNKFLAPSFAKKLTAINTDNNLQKVATSGDMKIEKKSISQFFDRYICSTDTEKAAFALTWKMTGRDKGFKLQFYPGMAYIVVFIFIIVFKSGSNITSIWKDLPSSSSFIWLFYLPMMTVSSSIALSMFNENYAASWVYHSMPVEKPGQLISGMVKALFIKFFLPIFLILTIFCFYIWGTKILDDALFALINNLFCFLIFANLLDHYLPFSRQPNTQQQTGKFLKSILQLIVIGVTVGIHYLLIHANLNWLLIALTPLLAIPVWYMFKSLQNLKWSSISI